MAWVGGALAAAVALGACSPFYVARLGWTQARILMRREPIPSLLQQPGLDPALRDRLQLVLATREFARDRLGLKVGDSYTTFAEVDDGATVHVLSAAHRDRLESYTWWYPIAGRVPYRGFFDPGDAASEAKKLASEQLDVDVRPALAFSTLGWFADPLLSTTAAEAPDDLVETVIHELFHATLYVPGESAFNESAATFAGHRGAIAFFCDGPGRDAERCAKSRARWAAVRARGRVLTRLQDRLRRLYAMNLPVPVRERQRIRLTEAAARTLDRRGLRGRDELVPPNNARLLGALLYATGLDDFEALAPGDVDPAPGIRALVHAVRETDDPFAAVQAAAAGTSAPPA
jgi:predicted aminopeptidase